MDERIVHRDWLPFIAMVSVEFSNVITNTLFKAAALHGLNYYAFIVYTFVLSSLSLLPFYVISHRKSELPHPKLSTLCKISILGLIGLVSQFVGYKGISYGSPTLASAIGNLTPAFTFILAIIFRMEKLALRSLSTEFKIGGTAISIVGALVVTMYKGPPVMSLKTPSVNQLLSALQSDWVTGAIYLAAQYLLLAIWYIFQAHIMKEYPAEIIVVFMYQVCGSILSLSLGLFVIPNLDAWIVRTQIGLAAVLYSGLLGSSLSTLVHTWGLHLKGPVYIATFRPLSIVFAAAMGVFILGDTLYLGSVIGSLLISIGFYAVIWGKAKEEIVDDSEINSLQASSSQKTPLLQDSRVENI
ncbi:EamA domain [Dillenia turbinata]|uniref:WAT1-related protein n=1 Tax=Dillenia turbinata TaxID=194707 RepID=A0AAN8UA23_9MAGN